MAQKDLPRHRYSDDDEFSPIAVGNRIHAALATVLGVPNPDWDEVLAELKSERERVIVQWFHKRARELIDHYGEIQDRWAEKRMVSKTIPLTGMPDLAVKIGGCWHIFDWKSGYGKVTTASKNLQGRGYVVLLAEETAAPTVYFHLFSAGNDEEEKFTSCVYGFKDIENARQYVEVLCLLAPNGGDREPSLDACRFCRACGNPQRCPESMVVAKELKDVAEPILLPAVTEEPPTRAVALALTEAYDRVELGMQAGKRFQQYVRTILEAHPNSLPGLKLSAIPMETEVTDAKKTFETAIQEGWVADADEFVNGCVKVSLAQLREVAKPYLREKGHRVKDHKALINGVLDNAGAVTTKQRAPRILRVKEEKRDGEEETDTVDRPTEG